MGVKEDIREQIVGALTETNFPINSPEELMAALPNGPDTTCKSGDVELKAPEAGKVLTADDFPFTTAEEVADTIVNKAGL